MGYKQLFKIQYLKSGVVTLLWNLVVFNNLSMSLNIDRLSFLQPFNQWVSSISFSLTHSLTQPLRCFYIQCIISDAINTNKIKDNDD